MEGFRSVDSVALKQLIEDSGVSFRQNKRSYIFTCPRCQKRDKLMMLKAGGKFVCWVCAENSGFRGRPEVALTELLNISLKDIRKKIYGESAERVDSNFFTLSLADFYGDDIPPADVAAQQKGLKFPLDFYPIEHVHARRGLEYVLGRGIDVETARYYDLRYCPVQKRVIFPVRIGPKLVGWQARFILDTEWVDEETQEVKKIPKILTTGPRDTVLMFQDNLCESDHVIICEGPVDAIKCHLAGGAVATMGKVVSDNQVKIIKGSGVRKVYLGLDDDATAETAKLLKLYSDYADCKTGALFEIRILRPAPGYEDLGAMPPELVLKQFNEAPLLPAGSLLLDFQA